MSAAKRFRLSAVSLRAQLIFSFLAVTILVLSASSYFSYAKTLEILKRRTQDTTFSQFRQIETNILTMMNEVYNYSNTLLYEGDVQTFLQSPKLPNADFIPIQQQVTKLMTRYFSNYDYLDSIYLFADNGMVIGGTPTQNQSSVLTGKDYPFYSHPLYKLVKEHYPSQFLWSGGVTTKEFMRTPLAFTVTNNRLISALRGITSMDVRSPGAVFTVNAVLAVNIKERHLNSLYGSLSSPGGSISIIDETGKVISSTAENSIDSQYAFNGKITGKITPAGFGSFSADRNGVEEQIIYYRMKETGWILVNEVPTKLYAKDIISIQRVIAGIFLLSIVLILLFSSLWMNRIMKSFLHLIKGMKNVGRGQIGLTLPQASNKEMGQLIEQFNSMSIGIMELMNKNEEAEKVKRRLEIESLQSQINPHFLYNTLNTVKWMAAIAKAPNIMECMTSLGNMLRPIFYDPSPFWSIREEIDFVKHYVNIMNFRYGEEIRFEIDVPDHLTDCRVLRFMIQPSIENALIHGSLHKGVIRIAVSESGGLLLVEVLDTCGGMPPDKVEEVRRAIETDGEDGQTPSKKGIGLYNVNKRIRLHFGERYGIEVRSEGDATTVWMRIPAIRTVPAVQKS